MIQFKIDCFLTDFSQTFASNWNVEEVYGRPDPIAMFKNTRRTISLAWDIPAGSMAEAKANLGNSRKLIKMLYPAYMKTETAPASSLSDIAQTGLNLLTSALGGSPEPSTPPPVSINTQTLAKPPLVKVKYANLIKNSQDGGGLLGWIDNLNIKPVLDMGYFHSGSQLYPKVLSISCNFNVLHQHALGHDANTQGWLGGKTFPF